MTDKAYQLKVTLKDTKPIIWRRAIVPANITLIQLHDVLQIVMGWEDEHLHQFIIKKQRYSIPDPEDFYEVLDERKAVLSQLITRQKSKFTYKYDFGDSWEHEIVVEKILPLDKQSLYPVCVTGKRACPPEDSGGVWGYADKLRILKHPKDSDYEDILDWMGEDFDPDNFDIHEVNKLLKKLQL